MRSTVYTSISGQGMKMEAKGSTAAGAGVGSEAAEAVSAEDAAAERRRILRNVLLMSAGFMLHFTAYFGTSNLQSSINSERGLGTASLATVYAAFILSNLFLPVPVIRWLGCKWAVALSMLTYMPFIAAHFGVGWATLLPAAALVGLGGGPLWCAKATYLTVVSHVYSGTSGEKADVILARFMGIFFMIFQLSQVWGNLISSSVFSSQQLSDNAVTGDLGDVCGANYFAPDAQAPNTTNAVRPPDSEIYTVAGIYLGCMALASGVVAMGVDSLGRYNEKGRQGAGSGLTGIRVLAVTLMLLRKRNQQLLLPFTMYLGFAQAFLFADFTAAFVSCAWGISNIGYVMMCYGVVNSLWAVGAGWLVRATGRAPVVLVAALVQGALLVALLRWRPHTDDRALYFVVSGLWGACDGCLLAQVNAMSGVLFPGEEEAAFSNFRLWESLGYIIGFAYSSYIFTYVKIYVLLAFLVVGLVMYVAIEMSEKRRLANEAP